ncbi:translocase [Candidatus Gottesmanbacteria bacterium RIFCSPLOWO2_01_FULL_39_12b]|uniref:Sec-independent protein translocase protein TatA n=1 Tax=Candidatus Gottesmanbacteria bacterium RIFCSPLOWO2_01_FULL_39_12b TaxID=1798388 RepID=A0A1F6AN55_9BACT|nr:MAG: translocase [Candidatus Gottesmanbacteria bacterium RIFCSPLOWO2_01_FULL_39_12b]
MLNGIGTTEIVVVGLVLLVMFGGKKLPELARGMGDSIKEFRKAVGDNV